MLLEELMPTQERLQKDEAFDTPLVDSKTNRRMYRRLDTFQALLRDGKIEMSHCDAGQRYVRHYQGRQKIDVRITDLHTVSNASLDGLMPPFQYHGSCLAEAKAYLTPHENSSMEYVAQFETEPEITFANPLIFIGSQFGGYKNRKEAMGYGLSLLHTALERLAYLWGFKLKGKQ